MIILILIVLIGLCYALTMFLNMMTIACTLTTRALNKVTEDLEKDKK
jgi:hypothetical protein